MVRRPGENRLNLRDWQPEISRDVGFIDTGFPILNDVIDGHTCAFQHGTTALHTRLYFYKRAIRPIHRGLPVPVSILA